MKAIPIWIKTALALALLALLAGGASIFRAAGRHWRQHAENELMAIARLKADQISKWRLERLADASVLMDSPFLHEGIAHWMADPKDELLDNILARFAGLSKHYGYRDVLFVDPEGKPLVSLGGSDSAFHEELLPTLADALRSRAPRLTDLHVCSVFSSPHLSAIAPLFMGGEPDSPALGALVLVCDAETFLYPLIETWPAKSQTAETLLVRREGDDVLFLNDLRFKEGAALQLRLPLSREDLPAAIAVQGKEAIVEGRDYADFPVVAAVLPIPDSPWFIVSKQHTSEVHAFWRFSAALLLALFLGLAALAAVSIFLVWQRKQKSHYEALYRSEAARRASEERYETTINSIGDGVIATDAEGRVTLLNPVAEALTGWSEEEARGRPLDDVFRIVNEETRAPALNPVERALREGRIVGLANHTALIARDGTERSIADSAAPIRSPSFEIEGVVLVFRDQTAERAAQRQLQRIEWMLQPGRGADAAARERFDSPYGDLSALNSSRTILNAVGPKLLESIVREGLDLLDTSAAVYEASGEYALGLFSSGWCRFLDQASRALCGCEDNAEALACGKWLCHESCWTRASKASIETGKPVDIECEGGIRLYAVPIRAGGEVLGSVNLGYGEPPRDPDTLRALAERFGVDAGELAAQAVCYESRPPFVIEIAKRRLEASALLIGEIVERHRAQELLKESQKSIERANELMSAVLDHTHVLTVCLDSRFNFIWVNRAYADTCKRSPDFFPGKNHFELYPHEESQAIFQRAADSGEPFYAYAKPFVFTDQPERGVTYWDWSLVPLKGDNGQTERLILSLADVTGRIRVELALRESEETHRALVEGIPDVVMRFDRDGRHLFVSENVEQVAGIPARRFIGKTHRELGFPEDLCRFWEEAIRQVFDSGEPHETEFSFAGPAGTAIFDWRLVPEFDAQNKAKSVLSISRDITAHRRAEENYETLFREMLDGFALHEIILDERGEPADYRFLAVNPAFERLTGLSAEALVGKTVLEALPGTEPHWIRTYGRVALTGEPAFFEDYHGELDKHFEVRAFRPGPNQFACIFADITARKRAEAERESMREQLEQARKMESVGRLAGGVAHDFNNMLGVILGYVEMVLEEVDSAVPMHADLQEIKRAAQRSADLTRQLLAFARKQTIAPKVLDLNETIGGTLNFLRRLIGESVELAWKPAEGLWPVKVDPTQIDQILTNLCANARDAIAAGPGSIFIETQNVVFDEEHRAAHADFAPGAFVMLAVADNGPGIPREVLKHVFEPFFTTKEVGQGTGLGLATVYGIAKQNNGFVHIYSEPGKGTIVKIYLPRYHGDGQAAPAAENESPRGRAETVLLVEDEAAILHMSKSMLEKLGYTVHAFGRPADAIQFAQRHVEKIDLLLTDVVMPEMNGRELADRIEAIAPGVKRLFMSGYTASAIAHHGILDEGLMLIHKPFSRGALARKVREALEANPGGAD